MTIDIGMKGRSVWLLSVMLAAGLSAPVAHAALGDQESTISVDAKKLGGSVKTLSRATYQVHEIALPSGTVLREFATAGGKVFAVAWKGPALPNMKQALGQYFEVASAAKAKTLRRRNVEIRNDQLVFQSGGHMRAFTGRAYLPAAIPAGVDLNELH